MHELFRFDKKDNLRTFQGDTSGDFVIVTNICKNFIFRKYLHIAIILRSDQTQTSRILIDKGIA